jgi:hypothetical protein
MDGVLQSLAPDLVVRGRPKGDQQPGDFWLLLPGTEKADEGGAEGSDAGMRKGPAAGFAAGPWW